MNKRPVYYDESEGIAWTHTPHSDKVIVSWVDRKWIEDYSVSRWGCKRCPYASIKYEGKRQLLHRLIMGSQGHSDVFDHTNRDAFDNRRENLRPASSSMNNQNVSKQANTSSRFLGVNWHKQYKKWEARVRFKVDGKSKRKFLGYFTSEIEAAKAYDAAVDIYQTPGATTNESLGLLDTPHPAS